MKSKTYFQSLKILHLAFVIGLVLFGGVSFYLQSTGEMGVDAELGQTLLLLAVAVGAGGILGGKFLFTQMLAKAQDKDLTSKMDQYRTATIIRYALVEAPALIALIGYLLSGNVFCLAVAGALVAWFVLLVPSQQKTINELDLSGEERRQVEDPEAIIASSTS